MYSIKKNYEYIQKEIYDSAISHARKPEDISLIAVSKFQSKEKIEEAYACGIRDFAENYVQEWQKKSQELSHLQDIRWHLIGNIQKNKVKFLNDKIFCLQSLDSLSLAQELEKKWSSQKLLNVLVQLQIDDTDTNKSGIAPEQAKPLCEFIRNSTKLKLSGFMGIGPNISDESKLKKHYQNFVNNCDHLWQFYSNINGTHLLSDKPFSKIISLGMSQDFKIAIACGSTMIRLGTALFGSR